MIKFISSNAFYYCYSLKYVSLPTSISHFMDSCFSQCTSLSNINIPQTALISKIGKYSFFNTRISSFNINAESKVSNIEEYAFSYCTELKSFTFIQSTSTVCAFAFSYSGLKEVNLSTAISQLNNRCFYGCTSLQLFKIPKDSILMEHGFGLGVFGCCKSLATIICAISNFKIINGVLFTQKGERLLIFPPASNISCFIIPESIVMIPNEAFIGCSNLLSVFIQSNSVKTIGYGAFEDCINLHYINIPIQVTTVAENAFKGCNSLRCGVDIESKDITFINNLINTAKLSKNALKKCDAKSTCKYDKHQSPSRIKFMLVIS